MSLLLISINYKLFKKYKGTGQENLVTTLTISGKSMEKIEDQRLDTEKYINRKENYRDYEYKVYIVWHLNNISHVHQTHIKN